MSCPHKFYEELQLTHLDYKPETLIVGTFNPKWPEKNTAEWFYGRTVNNNFWDVLPRLYGEQSLIQSGLEEWKDFCRRNGIAITDLVACIKDAEKTNPDHVKWLGGYGDAQIAKNFKSFEFTKIEDILRHFPSIKYIYLTRGAQGFWKGLWNPIEWGRRAQTLMTPSDWARVQHLKFIKRNQQQRIERLPDFILTKWQEKWHFNSH